MSLNSSTVSVYRRGGHPYHVRNDEASSEESDELRFHRYLQRKYNEDETPYCQSRMYHPPSESEGKAFRIVCWIAYVILSCAVRYSLEALTNLICRIFIDEKNWVFLAFDNGCGPESHSLLCEAVQICIKEVVPSLIPNTADDVLIQSLLILIFTFLRTMMSSKEKFE